MSGLYLENVECSSVDISMIVNLVLPSCSVGRFVECTEVHKIKKTLLPIILSVILTRLVIKF